MTMSVAERVVEPPIRPIWSSATWSAFEIFFRPWMGRRIQRVLVRAPYGLQSEGPVILAANHMSWWDGFLLREVHRRLRPDAPLFTVMLERELARVPFLRRLGAIPIDPTRPASVRAVFRALRAESVRDPAPLVSWFPQGRIEPSWKRPLALRPGIPALARALAPCSIVPVALHLEPLATPAPTAFVSVGAPIPVRTGPGAAPRLGAVEWALEVEVDRVLTWIEERGERAWEGFEQSGRRERTGWHRGRTP
jgi:1-acyl-sn-glycerol-3-phosphate acyltransferase